MADDFTTNLLKKLRREDLVEQFKKDGVEKEVVEADALTDAYLDPHFASVGQRMLFVAKLKKELSNDVLNTAAETQSVTHQPESGADDLSDDELSSYDGPSTSKSVPTKKLRVRRRDDPDATFVEKRARDVKVNKAIQELDVRKILTDGENCELVKAIVRSYDNNTSSDKYLTDQSRRQIVNYVGQHLLSISLELKNCHFKLVAEKIVQVFPTEKVPFYYKPPFAVPGKDISTGKIPVKYRNLKTLLRKATSSQVPATTQAVPQSQGSADPYLHILQYVEDETEASSRRASEEFLSFHRKPFPKVLECWEKTAMIRLQNLLKENRNQVAQKNKRPSQSQPKSSKTPEAQVVNKVYDYYKKWTILGHPSGIQLLCSDFKLMWPLKEGQLYVNWAEFERKFLHYTKEAVTDAFGQNLLTALGGDQLTKDQRVAHILYLLLTVCKPETRINLPGQATVTKVSVADCKDSVILLVPSLSDLRTAIKRRAERFQYTKTSSQPVIVLVGQTLTSIKSHHINIDKTLYSVTNTISALDACFQSYFALHAEYPRDGGNIWLIIQRCLYNIETAYDNMSIGNLHIHVDRHKAV